VLPVEVGGVPGRGGVSSGVGSGVCSGVCCQHQLGRAASVPLHLMCVCQLFAEPFGKEGIRTGDCDEAKPGDFPLQPSPLFSNDTQHSACSVLVSRRDMSD
jgi:hypothetical protein